MGMPRLLTRGERRRRNRLQSGRLHLGTLAGIKSERWPTSIRNRWPACFGIRKRESEGEITEREVTILLADFATVWNELFPAEQARIVQLLVERVDVQEDVLEVRIRAEGLASLVGELRQRGERKAA
jgi:hypothetical protein